VSHLEGGGHSELSGVGLRNKRHEGQYLEVWNKDMREKSTNSGAICRRQKEALQMGGKKIATAKLRRKNREGLRAKEQKRPTTHRHRWPQAEGGKGREGRERTWGRENLMRLDAESVGGT